MSKALQHPLLDAPHGSPFRRYYSYVVRLWLESSTTGFWLSLRNRFRAHLQYDWEIAKCVNEEKYKVFQQQLKAKRDAEDARHIRRYVRYEDYWLVVIDGDGQTDKPKSS